MTDMSYIRRIGQMNWQTLMREILIYPEYLSDSYYREIGEAMRQRAIELIKHHDQSTSSPKLPKA